MGCMSGATLGHMALYADVPTNERGIQECRDMCHAVGAMYFGLECPHWRASGDSAECYCGGTYHSIDGGLVSASECSGAVRQGRCAGPYQRRYDDLGVYFFGSHWRRAVYRIE